MQWHYSPAQQTLHWLTVVLMFSILPVAWVLISVTEETPEFFFWMDVHESIGLAIFFLTALRIAWRCFDPAPRYPASVGPWTRGIARLVHLGLLGAMIVMPVSGFLWTTGHGHAVAPFGLIHFPRIAFGYRALGDAAERVHLVGQWLLYGLITLHLAGVSYHLVVKRDNPLARMLPTQTIEHSEGQ